MSCSSTDDGPQSVERIVCPLCSTIRVERWHEDKSREYFRCVTCQLIFVPSAYHLSPSDEKSQYDLHQNSPDDHGYRRFLTRILEPIHARLEPGSSGLDFGSGPGPTLSAMFGEVGHRMAIYDPFYATDASPLAFEYDFVAASEVVEHFRNPSADLNRIWACLKPSGVLGIMTKRALDREAFAGWHYKDDRTHVGFFSRDTFEWLAAKWNAELTFVGDDVVLLSHRGGQTART